MGVDIDTIPAEGADTLSGSRFRDSRLYRAIESFKPDVLIVDLFWFTLDAFIRELACKKVLLIRQVDPRFFSFTIDRREFRFNPADYDLVAATEPGFELPFEAVCLEPFIMRNRDEILPAPEARAGLGLAPAERSCFFGFNGKEGEGAEAWKSFSYLEEEGWKVVRSDNRSGGIFPAVDWFNAFDMLVCGAGYSAFWEARAFDKEAYFVPYPRNFEDQYRRVALCSDYVPRENGADQLVRTILGW